MRKLAASFTLALLGLLPAGVARHAAAQDRVRSFVESSGAERVVIANTVVADARGAQDLGPVDLATPLANVVVRFGMSPAQSQALDRLLAQQQDPASPRFHQWLTPEQYGARFGLSEAEMASIAAWFEAQGLKVNTLARSRSFIAVSGSAAQIEHAFGTPIHGFSVGGEIHFANVSDPVLPAAIGTLVRGITGLNDFRLKPHLRAPARPGYTSSASGNHYIAPGDFYTIYDLNPLLNNSINGAGVTVAVMGQTDISLADVAAFRAASGLPAKAPIVKLYFTDPGTVAADIDQAQLDVEWAGAAAPGATVLYVNTNDVLGGSLTLAIDNNVAPILTTSYGNCESALGASNLAVYNQLFRQANAQGQTVIAPSGDSGATDCDFQTASAKKGLAVDFPASSPYVTGVGGSMFAENGGAYFGASNGSFAGSALSYIPETVWNETATLGTLAASGGGSSLFFTKPPFQIGAGIPNDFSRDVPDLSLNAGVAHDGYLFCSQGSCTNGFRNGAGSLTVAGGTYAAAPAFAGVLALLQQKIKSAVGNANPVLYGLANSVYAGSVFHDITSGSNASPCTAGTFDCPAGGSIGYAATAGYDRATGWGSVDAFNLVSDWLLVTPAGSTSTLGRNDSSTTLTVAPNNVAAGTSVNFTAVVASATAGLTTVPGGSVQLLLDGNLLGTGVAVSAGKAAGTISTAGLAAGPHTLTAAYSGDTVFAGSKGAIAVDLVTAAAPDFTLTPVTASTTVASGGIAPGVIFTVASLFGFSGPVTFSASSPTTPLNVTPSFNINPVNVAPGASGNTVLTLLAYRVQGQASHAAIPLAQREIPARHRPWEAGGVALGGLLLLAWPRRRSRAAVTLVLILSAGTLTLAGCTPQRSLNTPVIVNNAPAGTYSILVTATGTSAGGVLVTHNSTVTFVVQ